MFVYVWPSLWGRFCLFELRGRDPYIGLAGDISYYCWRYIGFKKIVSIEKLSLEGS